MGEIKSTLELVLERTAGLGLTQAERARQKAEEEAVKAAGLARRLWDGLIRPQDVGREIGEIKPEDEPHFRRTVAEKLIEMSDLASLDPDRFRELLEAAWPGRVESVWPEALSIQEDFRREHLRQEALARDKALQELAALGISGSAVRPKPAVVTDQEPFKARLKSLLA